MNYFLCLEPTVGNKIFEQNCWSTVKGNEFKNSLLSNEVILHYQKGKLSVFYGERIMTPYIHALNLISTKINRPVPNLAPILGVLLPCFYTNIQEDKWALEKDCWVASCFVHQGHFLFDVGKVGFQLHLEVCHFQPVGLV